MSGIVLTDFGIEYGGQGFCVDIRSDGKIIIGGNRQGATDHGLLVRYNTDGSLDTSFSADGTFTWAIGVDNNAESVLALSGGKSLVAGYAGNDSTGLLSFSLTRHNANGSFDTSFGGGDGQVVTNIGADDRAHAMAVQSNGKIVLAGRSDGNFAVVRYNADGTLDTSFGGGDGKVVTNIGADDVATSMSIQSNGKILLGGFSENNDYDFALVRYNSNGTLDTSFGGGDGKVVTEMGGDDVITGITTLADGKILVSGSNTNQFAVARYNSNGTLDTSFGGGDGKVFTNMSADKDWGESMVVLSNGKFLVAGYQEGSLGSTIGLVRYNANGTLDTSFGGGDGKVTTPVEAFARGYDMTVQSDGKIVVTGNTYSFGFEYLVVMRYNANGTLDTSFGKNSGTMGSNTLNGTTGADVLQGLLGNDTLIGAGGNDRLEGGEGQDILNGGLGNDILVGSNTLNLGEVDTFRFNSTLNASTNVDTILDFSASDVIQLENAIFAQLTVGALSVANFSSNATGTAMDGDDYIVYENDTGKLFYDADGSGAGAKVQFALLSEAPALSATDIVVI